MNIIKNKKTRVLIAIMGTLVLFGSIISYFYYININSCIDPRIVDARKLYEKYNDYTQNKEFESIFQLLDSIKSIYLTHSHYKQSYEIGVLYNNQAASFITMAIYSDIDSREEQDSLINLADSSVNKSISLYLNWMEKYKGQNPAGIQTLIEEEFLTGLDNFTNEQKNEFLRHRVKEIEESLTETKRRLSVAYTNLGIIHRHRMQYELAAKSYEQALNLWDRNLTAENNLNILLGRPLKKRNLIQKLFPPDRKKN